MITVGCVQGSEEWIAARLGIPTASCFHLIITPRTLKPSGSACKYRSKLIAEWLLNTSLDDDVATDLMKRGSFLEQEAVRFYEMERGATTTEVGFILRDDCRVGCSPDRLVGADGGLEVKCPAPHTHVGYLIDGLTEDYRCQIQGALWLTGRRWWDFLSYHPDLPSCLVRIERDEAFIAALAAAVDAFVESLEAGRRLMLELGAIPRGEAA